MTLSEIKEVLRQLPPDQLREVLVEFHPEVLTQTCTHVRTTREVTQPGTVPGGGFHLYQTSAEAPWSCYKPSPELTPQVIGRMCVHNRRSEKKVYILPSETQEFALPHTSEDCSQIQEMMGEVLFASARKRRACSSCQRQEVRPGAAAGQPRGWEVNPLSPTVPVGPVVDDPRRVSADPRE